MHELFHILGLCGEKHPSLIILLSEWPSIRILIDYIKILIDYIKTKL